MQPWEYKVLHRQRAVMSSTIGEWDSAVVSQLPQLGGEGWELVAVVPRSSTPGTASGGVTSDELWIFKRPKTMLDAETTVVVAQAIEPPPLLAPADDAVAIEPAARHDPADG